MKKLYCLAIILAVLNCNTRGGKYAIGVLHVTFQTEAAAENVQPSFQMALWLESQNDGAIKTMYVSEYLSYGGYNDSTICPAWNAVSNWGSASTAEFDARTGATLTEGKHDLVFHLKKEKIPKGRYKVNLQLHIVEEYNIFYSGEIYLGDVETRAEISQSYSPTAFPGAENVLNNVNIAYKLVNN